MILNKRVPPKRLLRKIPYFFLAFASFQQSAMADTQAKSPIPATHKIVAWTGVTGRTSSPGETCAQYQAINTAASPIWGWRLSRVIPNAGSRPDAEVYDCYYKYTYTDGHTAEVAFISTEAIYEWRCSSPYTLAGNQCVLPPKKEQCPKTNAGNPIDFSTGTKEQAETDYKSVDGELEFVRYYRSDSVTQNVGNTTVTVPAPGFGWQHNFHRALVLHTAAPVVTISRHNGTVYAFTLSNGVWTGDADDNARLQQLTDADGKLTGWVYTSSMNYTETYDADGRLTSVKTRAGALQTLTYDDTTKLLTRVVDSFGRQLQFAYDDQSRLKQLTTPDSRTYTYAYDTNGNLASVTYPDTKTRSYVYENASFPHALTGIIDENGARFATWKYDTQGRGFSSEHAAGIDKYTIDYSVGAYGRNVTDPLGATRSYTLSPLLDTVKILYINQPGGSGCNASFSGLTYDGNGNIKSGTDFNGNATNYTYDLTRNLETKRVIANGTAQAQTVSTIWHPTLNIPTQVNEPLLRTTYTHDTNGNILTKTLQATSDADGSQGANASPVGSPRVWTYTYNNLGQVLTFTGPRTDVVNKMTNTYDAQGNLISTSNGAGHVTTLTNYDANGRPGQTTDPNGVVTTYTYTERGWLKQRVVTAGGISETTTYDYDGVGQMTKVTLPDNSSINYTYDDAHRLTKVSDSLGNSINYTLDNIGNRINETVTDGGGNLKRQVTRIYDALNRLQQVTGAAQ